MPTDLDATEPWKTCYQQLAPRLLLFARQWIPSQFDAEDVVQTAFVRFWRRQPDARPEHYALLYAAVRSAALDALRADERRTRRETTSYSLNPELVFSEPGLEKREEAELVERALHELPAEQREALVLRIWGELTFAQIAEVSGASLNTVASRYRYGIEALRKLLKNHVHERV